jgi:hypothetical protein
MLIYVIFNNNGNGNIKNQKQFQFQWQKLMASEKNYGHIF